MNLKEIIEIEGFAGQPLKMSPPDSENELKASFSHYFNNTRQSVSQFYKKDALGYLENLLTHHYPKKRMSKKEAEEALQHLLFDFKSSAPFPEPKLSTFTFIDLFAGIGGFRMAFQNLKGKCIFTSEWDKYSKRTYEANFGEIPFGDITQEETKKYIPNNFDILCAGFPCQAFSIAGKRGGFEDTRGTLFFDVAKIIGDKQPKAFFLENVKGLRGHDKGRTLKIILGAVLDK